LAILHGMWVALLAAVLLVWVYRTILIHLPSHQGPALDVRSAPEVRDQGLVSVIVPAKDEEENIRVAIETILAQHYRNLEVIVVDDRSRDRTAEIVREVAAGDARVRLVQVTELPEGWFGKPHAMQVAAREARGQWLLFVDADCRQAPHSVQTSVDFLAREQGDMLSLWPVLEMHGFWENAVQPVAGSVLVAWFRPAWVNNPKHWAAFANGQYILLRRTAFDAVGGYEAVRTEIVEDIALARLVKRSGHRLLNAVGKDLSTTRMYTTLPQMAKGWRRIYYGAFKSPAWLGGVIALTFLFTLLPFLTLAHASVHMALGEPAPWVVAEWALSLGILGLLFVTMQRYFVMARTNRWYLLFYPLAVVLVLGFQFQALLRALGFGTVTWRGTTYKGNKVVGGAGGQGAGRDAGRD